jgi:hypothetical protein
MDLSLVFPPDAVAWLTRYGVFGVVLFFTALLLALLLRPFWLWYTGRSEELDRLKHLEDAARKSLLELEVLNQTLAIPVKRAAQKAKAAEKADEPMVVSREAKDAFLKVLENSRSRVLEAPPEDPKTQTPS